MNTNKATVIGWHKEETECVCVCASHPSGAGSSWSAMRFGLPVARWLTFEPPALHHALKTFPNASHERGKLISAFILSDLKKKKRYFREERPNRAAARTIGSRRELTTWL